jgi:glycosyltransferase involved in cell wall biosynthesis
VRDRITIVPNGVDVRALLDAQPFPADASIPIVTVGRLANYKRVDRAIEAMHHLDERFVLTIIGRGPMADELRRRIRSEGLTERVRMIGDVGDTDLARWLRTAAAFVLLSEHESFSITPREALAAGAPVVISDIPVHREIGRDAGAGRVTLVPLGAAPQQIAEAIRAAALRPPPPTRYLPATWDEVAARTLEVYDDVARGAARSA